MDRVQAVVEKERHRLHDKKSNEAYEYAEKSFHETSGNSGSHYRIRLVLTDYACMHHNTAIAHTIGQ